MRGAEDTVLLEQVVNHCLLLPVDPAGDEENNEGERRRQRVHGASVPERLAQCKARRDSRSALPGWAEFPDRKPPAIAANAPIVEQSGLGGVFAQDGHRTEEDPGRPYHFKDTEALIDDFFNEVERVLRDRRVGLEVIRTETLRRSK